MSNPLLTMSCFRDFKLLQRSLGDKDKVIPSEQREASKKWSRVAVFLTMVCLAMH